MFPPFLSGIRAAIQLRITTSLDGEEGVGLAPKMRLDLFGIDCHFTIGWDHVRYVIDNTARIPLAACWAFESWGAGGFCIDCCGGVAVHDDKGMD